MKSYDYCDGVNPPIVGAFGFSNSFFDLIYWYSERAVSESYG